MAHPGARRLTTRSLLPLATLFVAALAGACVSGASPTRPPAPVGVSPTVTVQPSLTAIPSIDPELGPAPTPRYPDVEAIGVGTLRIVAPREDAVRFWITCEWPTTDGVGWIYLGRRVMIYGEAVDPDVALPTRPGDLSAPRVTLYRDQMAPYTTDPDPMTGLAHSSDWTSGKVTFEHLHIDPEGWGPGPLPTPKAAYERPLGGVLGATDLAGTFGWECGPRPATVPTPGPVDTSTPEPTGTPFPTLPDATLVGSAGSRVGVVGCGTTWDIDGNSGGVSCGPSFQVLPDTSVVSVDAGGTLRFTLPTGYHFTSWVYEYVDQSSADLYRGEDPPSIVRAGEGASTTATTIKVKAPPVGAWTIRLWFAATNGHISVGSRPDYFRVEVH